MELTLSAAVDNLPLAQDFVETLLAAHDCPYKAMLQISLVVEEIYVNIAQYAYPDGQGEVTIRATVQPATHQLTLCFADAGQPFNPLLQTPQAVNLPLEDCKIGGLGLLLAQKIMDSLSYAHENGQNMLTLTKQYEVAI